MAIENIFSGLGAIIPPQRTLQDIENESMQKQLMQQQLANAQLQGQTAQLGLRRSQQDYDLQDAIRQAGKNSIDYDEQGLPTLNTKRLVSGVAQVDPLAGADLQSKFTKDTREARKFQLENILSEMKIKKELTTSATNKLRDVQTPQQFDIAHQAAIAEVAQLGDPNLLEGVKSWRFEDKDRILMSGLELEKQLNLVQKQAEFEYQKLKDSRELGYKQKDIDIKQKKLGLDEKKLGLEAQKQDFELSGQLTPEKQDDLISKLRSDKGAIRNRTDFDKSEAAFSGIKAFFAPKKDSQGNEIKDKAGNTILDYKYKDDKTGIYDVRLLVSAIKADDPTSTVTQNEIISNKDTRGVPDKFKGYANRLISGQALDDKQRTALFTSAQNKSIERRKLQSELELPIIKQALSRGISLDNLYSEEELKRFKLDNINLNNDDRRNNPLGLPQSQNKRSSEAGLRNVIGDIASLANTPVAPELKQANIDALNQEISRTNDTKKLQVLNQYKTQLINAPTTQNIASNQSVITPKFQGEINFRAKKAGMTPEQYLRGLQEFRSKK